MIIINIIMIIIHIYDDGYDDVDERTHQKIFCKLRVKGPTPYMMMYWTLCTLDEVCDSKDDEKSKLKSF